jgi:hypothetical protein
MGFGPPCARFACTQKTWEKKYGRLVVEFFTGCVVHGVSCHGMIPLTLVLELVMH